MAAGQTKSGVRFHLHASFAFYHLDPYLFIPSQVMFPPLHVLLGRQVLFS